MRIWGYSMQIEVYKMEAAEDSLTITLEAVCDTFSSLLWDIEYYKWTSAPAAGNSM